MTYLFYLIAKSSVQDLAVLSILSASVVLEMTGPRPFTVKIVFTEK
jgi:hypothetical protein